MADEKIDKPDNWNGGKKRTRVTMAVKRERLDLVCQWVVDGMRRPAVRKKAMEEFGVARSTADTYYLAVVGTVIPSWYEWADKRSAAAVLIAKLEEIHRLALKCGDLATGVRSLRQVAELQGLNSPRMIADQRGTLAAELAALKSGQGDTSKSGESAPREQVNSIRQSYGQPTFATDEEYQAWLDGMSPNTGNN